MTNLRNSKDPMKATANIYFKNKQIRQCLIQAGLINTKGDILPLTSSKHVTSQRSSPNKNQSSKIVHSYIVKEENKRQTNEHNQFEITVANAEAKKNSDSKPVRRVPSKVRHSPSPTKKKHSSKRAKSSRRSSHRSKTNLAISSAQISTKAKNQITMVYYGPQTIQEYDTSWCQPNGDEILVLQQHCGGENLTVFKGFVKPYGRFSFESRRHRDYPFAITLYINGLINSRISTCCEYRHKRNLPLGGKQGLFGIVNVLDAKPCKSCRYTKFAKHKRSTISVGFIKPPAYRSSFSPNFLTKNRSPSPIDTENLHVTQSFSTTKTLSPKISRTPTPSPERDETTRLDSVDHNRRRSSTDLHSIDQNIVAPPINNNDEQYGSDFEETNDDDLAQKNYHIDRARVSDSHSSEDEQSSDDSSTSSEQSDRFQHENKDDQAKLDLKVNNNNDNSRKSSPSTPIKSNQLKEEDNFFLSDTLKEKTNTIDQLQKSLVATTTTSTTTNKSSFIQDDNNKYKPPKSFTNKNNDSDNSSFPLSMPPKKSGPLIDEDDFFLSKKVAARPNPIVYSRKSSSDTSENSDRPSKYPTKTEIPMKNNNNNNTTKNNRLSLSNSFDHKDGDQNLLSNSSEIISRTSITKKTQETYLSSNVRRVSTSSSEDMFNNKYSSPSKTDKHPSNLNDDWFNTANKRDSTSNGTTKFNTNYNSASWRRAMNLDE